MFRTGLLVAGLIVLSSLAVTPAMAKVEILPDQGVLYFTNKLIADNLANPGNPTGAGGPKIFEATDVAPTEATSKKAYTAPAGVAVSFETAFQWAATQPFTIDGDVTASFWLSCDVAALYSGAAFNTYRLTMKKNGATIGTAKSAADASPQTCSGPTSIREVSVTLTLPKTSWKAGETIGASFAVWAVAAPEAAAKNMHFLVGSTTHPSHIRAVGIPLAAGASAPAASKVVEADINGETAEVSQSFDNATSDTYIYNWTTEAEALRVNYTSAGQNGSARLSIVDGSGTEVVNELLEGDMQGEQDVPDAVAGTWKITIVYDSFVGSVSVTIAAPPQETTTAAPSPTNATTTSAANETGSAKSADGEGIPSLGLFGVSAILVAAAIVVRRRR